MNAGRRPLRVLHCPNNIAGNPAALARAEREAGLDSICVALGPSAFGYAADEMLWDDDTLPSSQKARLRAQLLHRALRDFDIVHFNFGQTIAPPPRPVPQGSGALAHARGAVNRSLWLGDLPVLRAAGKVVVVTFQGDDARQGDFCRRFPVNASEHVDAHYYTPTSDRLKRTAIRRFDRYADLIYSLNPDLLHVLPPRANFLPYASVDPRDWSPAPAPANPRPVVLHAPTHRGVKGTRFILDAVDTLQREGLDFEFILVEGLTHAEAKALYARADVLVDQLLLGWYGALAVELMALAKPVICYLRDGDLRFLSDGMRADLPIVTADPASIATTLRRVLLMSPGERAELGERGRRYVERWHDPQRIALRLAADYTAVHDMHRRRLPRLRVPGQHTGDVTTDRE